MKSSDCPHLAASTFAGAKSVLSRSSCQIATLRVRGDQSISADVQTIAEVTSGSFFLQNSLLGEAPGDFERGMAESSTENAEAKVARVVLIVRQIPGGGQRRRR
jgi:hypothetical protein